MIQHHSSQPMYLQIKAELLRQIERKILMPGDRLPTEYQLMEQYKVSRITVSKAMNELKQQGLVERFPNKGTFVARSLAPSSFVYDSEMPYSDDTLNAHIPEIACIIPTIDDMFSLSMLNGVLSAFPQSDYLCHTFQSGNPQKENYLLKRCLETNMAGIVLFPQDQPFFSNELLMMHVNKYPLVLLDRYLPRLDTSYVISDNQIAGELCLRHLQDLGHQRIAFITSSGQDTLSVKYRIRGILAACEKLNIPEDFVHIIDRMQYYDTSKHYEEMLLKLVKQDRVTAFIACESQLCSYLYQKFTSLNFRLPGDVSLMSFDKTIVDSQPPDFFTHINQFEFLMGREAGTILRQCIELSDTQIHHRVITPKLEIHRSTGAVVL